MPQKSEAFHQVAVDEIHLLRALACATGTWANRYSDDNLEWKLHTHSSHGSKPSLLWIGLANALNCTTVLASGCPCLNEFSILMKTVCCIKYVCTGRSIGEAQTFVSLTENLGQLVNSTHA